MHVQSHLLTAVGQEGEDDRTEICCALLRPWGAPGDLLQPPAPEHPEMAPGKGGGWNKEPLVYAGEAQHTQDVLQKQDQAEPLCQAGAEKQLHLTPESVTFPRKTTHTRSYEPRAGAMLRLPEANEPAPGWRRPSQRHRDRLWAQKLPALPQPHEGRSPPGAHPAPTGRAQRGARGHRCPRAPGCHQDAPPHRAAGITSTPFWRCILRWREQKVNLGNFLKNI